MKKPSRLDVLRTPEHLTGLAKEYWELHAPILWKQGLLNEETRPKVVEGAELWGRLRELMEFFGEHSETTEDEEGNPVHRPEYREWLEVSVRFLDFSHNHGFTPLGRAEMARRGGTIGNRQRDPREEHPEAYEDMGEESEEQ
jgi:phage terminase small subunit